MPEPTFTAAQRERLRAQVSYAGEVVAPNWPIRTFISRNPLSGFESMTFDMAIRRAHELFGGRGMLSLDEYRDLYRRGRILKADVQAAIETQWPAACNELKIGTQSLAPVQVVLVHVLYGIHDIHPNLYHWKLSQGDVLERIRSEVPEEIKGQLQTKIRQRLQGARPWNGETTLAEWIAQMTGIDVPRWILETMARDQDHTRSRTSGVTGSEQHGLSDDARDLVLPSWMAAHIRQPDDYRKALSVLFERFQSQEQKVSLSFSAFASRWIAVESELLPALAEYFFGLPGDPMKFENWTGIFARPDAWYLKGLWLSAVNATGAADPALPKFLQKWLSGKRTRSPEKNNDGLPSDASAFVRPLSERVGTLTDEDLVERLNEIMIRWCSAFLDEGLSHWTMPERSRGFYRAWKALARYDYSMVLRGMRAMKEEIDRWPDRPEDAIVVSLRRMDIPENQWEEYFRRHLVQLPGWVGYIRWRTQNPEHPRHRHAPIDLVDYLAVRLFYEAALTEHRCRRRLTIRGTLRAVEEYERVHRRLLDGKQAQHRRATERIDAEAWRLFELAQFLGWLPTDIQALSSDDLGTLWSWLDRFPENRQGLIWQTAYETGYRRTLLDNLLPATPLRHEHGNPPSSSMANEAPLAQPQAQAVFCIDVRSEPLRRHFEAQGNFETIGFAGFFGVPLCYQGLGSHEQAALCPVLIKPKNTVREIPRPGQEHRAQRFAQGLQWTRFGQHLFHELKSHPITSFLLIDVMGWMFGVALLGKTLFPVAFHRLLSFLTHWVRPSVATRIPVDKLSKAEVERLLDEGERELVRSFLHRSSRWRPLATRTTPELLDLLRRHALNARSRRAGGTLDVALPDTDALEVLGLSAEQWPELIQELHDQCGITLKNRQTQFDRLSTEGFTITEQAFMVERALQLTGLTHTFARLVLWCGHGSTTENNPYAAAYDCGACGGNHGGPNARVLATMANNPKVRRELRDRGIAIPEDTWFLAGEHNTTTDQVMLFDLDDVPASHRSDVQRLQQALSHACRALAQERCQRLPGAPARLDPQTALRHTYRRSVDWAQIRPEWGLSGNAAFIIGSRALTKHLDLQGRTFLHNYEAAQDRDGKILEIIMTAPLVVAEWINLQYFFSAVDPWIYGSGSKVLHNVVGGIGVMLGAHADFQQGLPLQTVRDGTRLFHEPLRLSVVIQAAPQTLSWIINQHTILQYFFHHGWVHLLAIDPATGHGYEYGMNGQWRSLASEGKT